ncbi:ComEC/Rec2 family competence protein [Alteribacter natronophilus]|uniref:ComEC/Rec2 family competence protein n=1 Tax=Alteribacter natronophilus TaxID=2583810 RepID=UPI00110F335F|nr:MBL fold metallo-hydrolase [Alteribacter natronophilus]TMW73564.1 MBL fold metallo-hydrolase [Alteribacter natronophilus]
MKLYGSVIRAVLAAVFLIFTASAGHVAHAMEEVDVDLNIGGGDLACTFFDLSHGESTLLVNGEEETVLIDTGHRMAREDLELRLEMYHIDQVDTVIVTNKQAEYTGNLTWIIEEYGVNRVIMPEAMYSDVKPAVDDTDAEVSFYSTGSRFEAADDVKAHVLYTETRPGILEGASVLMFEHENDRLLYMSVADDQIEAYLTKNEDVKATVLKVAEFASMRGTTQLLLDESDPQVAVIFKNGDEEPSPFVLERLQGTWIEIFQTARTGSVSIKWHDGDYEIFTVRPAEKSYPEEMASKLKDLFGTKSD